MYAVSKKFFAGMCLACLSFASGGTVIAGQAAKVTEKRPAKWATPLEKPGLSNLFKVSDDLYRGAQPEDRGFAELVKLGVKTVVSLRTTHSDREELDKTSMNYRHIKFSPFHPEEEDVIAFLKILADPAGRPVFVHCKHGSDRTGTMTAYYRIVFQGWTKEEAIREMTAGGYGFHSIWRNLVKFIRKSDIEKIRKASGIK